MPVARAFASEYLGRSASPDSVKKTVVVHGITLKIDRPKGFVMRGQDASGKPWERKYLYDYGFIPETEGGDGEGVDVFVGGDARAQTAYWVRQRKDDGAFDEYKAFLGFSSRADAEKAYKDHIPARYFDGICEVPIAVMKALLGLSPAKLAMRIALFDELSELRTGG